MLHLIAIKDYYKNLKLSNYRLFKLLNICIIKLCTARSLETWLVYRPVLPTTSNMPQNSIIKTKK